MTYFMTIINIAYAITMMGLLATAIFLIRKLLKTVDELHFLLKYPIKY